MPTIDEIMKMNSGELKELRKQYAAIEEKTPEQEAGIVELDTLITKKTVQEELAASKQTDSFLKKSAEFDAKAQKLWPELDDSSSDFAKKVAEAVEAAGDSETNAKALLNAANEIGIELGLQPAGNSPKPGAPPTGALKGGADTEGDEGEGDDAFIKRTSNVAHAFRDVIDVGDPEVRKRLTAYANEEDD